MTRGRARKVSNVVQPSLQPGYVPGGRETALNGPFNGPSVSIDLQMGVLIQQVQALTGAVQVMQQQQAMVVAAQQQPPAPSRYDQRSPPRRPHGRKPSSRLRRSPHRSSPSTPEFTRPWGADTPRAPRATGHGGHRKRLRSSPEPSSEDSTPKLSRRNRESRQFNDDRLRRRDLQPTKYEDYTTLSLPRADILMEIESKNYLRRPPPLRPNPNRDQGKYCLFHRSAGHDTDECFRLRDEIENLIRRGYLSEFVHDGKSRPELAIEYD